MTARTLGGALAVLAALSSAGCFAETTALPPGTEPLETPQNTPAAEWPAWPASGEPVAVVTGVRPSLGGNPAHYWAHGRVVLAEPIADVWGALQWKPGPVVAVYPDSQVDCEASDRPEPEYEMSYGVKEIPNAHGKLGELNWFLVFWRGSTVRDPAQSILQANVWARKWQGTTYIELMEESAVITPDPGGGTRLEIVRHINARDESQTTAGDWIRLWVSAVQAQAAGAPLEPLTRCFPP